MESLRRKLKLILYKNNDFDAFSFSSISYSLTATFFFSLFSIPMISKSKIEFLSREAKFDEFTEFQETLNQRNRRKFETREQLYNSPPLPLPNTFLRDRSTKKNDAA